jgi:hypothetical protein
MKKEEVWRIEPSGGEKKRVGGVSRAQGVG